MQGREAAARRRRRREKFERSGGARACGRAMRTADRLGGVMWVAQVLEPERRSRRKRLGVGSSCTRCAVPTGVSCRCATPVQEPVLAAFCRFATPDRDPARTADHLGGVMWVAQVLEPERRSRRKQLGLGWNCTRAAVPNRCFLSLRDTGSRTGATRCAIPDQDPAPPASGAAYSLS